MGDHKRRYDWGLERLILLEMDRLGTTDGPIEIDGYDRETVDEHIVMLYRDGYITLRPILDASDLCKTPLELGFGLTSRGYSYLDLSAHCDASGAMA